MTIQRYFQWMRVWKWFAAAKSKVEIEALHVMLDKLWHEDCDKTSPQKLKEFAAAWALEERRGA
jgi:hypothetical protein